MKTITDDPETFFDEGGWSFLDPNSGDEAEADDEEDEEDEVYDPSGSEASADDSESDFSEESVVSEDDDESDGKFVETKSGYFIFIFHKIDNSLGSSEESGKDWSELEEEAAREDRNLGDFVDDYTAKKRKVLGKHSEKDIRMKRKADEARNSKNSKKIRSR